MGVGKVGNQFGEPEAARQHKRMSLEFNHELQLEDITRLSSQIRKSGHIHHVTRERRGSREIICCRKFAQVFSKQNALQISAIEPDTNENKLPDCLGLLGDRKIGLEETTAVQELREAVFNQHDVQYAEDAEKGLKDIISKKDKKAKNARHEYELEQIFLLIQAPSPISPSSPLAEYLRNMEIPRPKHIDRVFVVAPPLPSDTPVLRSEKYCTLTKRELESSVYFVCEIGFSGSRHPGSYIQALSRRRRGGNGHK